jgi:hypothetical protein
MNQHQNCNEQLIISPPGHVNSALNSMERNLRISISPSKILIRDQFFLKALGYHLPIQQSTSEWSLMPSSDGRSTSRRNKGNCKSNSEKCTGCSEADPNCQCTIICSYINSAATSIDIIVSNCGDVRKKQYQHNTTVSE